jgi:peroxiredoxin
MTSLTRRSFVVSAVMSTMGGLAGCMKASDDTSLVGKHAPTWDLRTVDGTKVGSAEFTAENKPYVLFFWATWCTTCQAELRSMKNIYPRFAEKVGFVAIGVDPTESADLLKQTAESRGYPWLIAPGTTPVLTKFGVIQTSTKFAIDREGIVVYEAEYGVGDDATWQKVFERLIAS